MLRLIGNRMFVALGVLVFANTLLADDGVPVERIVSEYTAMAGFKENALSVVEGLRTSRKDPRKRTALSAWSALHHQSGLSAETNLITPL